MNQCIKVVTITWSVLTVAVCSPLPQNVETIPSIGSTFVVSSTVDPDTIYLTTSFPQLPSQTVAIFRDVRDVNHQSAPLKDIKHGTPLSETTKEENSTEKDKSHLQQDLAKTENTGQNETQRTTVYSEKSEPDIKTSPIMSHDHNTDIYGKTTAEELADLSVIDVLLRKRRALSIMHQKQERSLPETAGSDEVLAEEEEESDEDVSQETSSGGSKSSHTGRKDQNLNREVKLSENGSLTYVTSLSSSNSDTQNGTTNNKIPEDKKSDINSEDTGITDKSNSSVVSNVSKYKDDESITPLNKTVHLASSVLYQHETDKDTTPLLKSSDSVYPHMSTLQNDKKMKTSEKHNNSVQNTSSQKSENDSNPLETHETKLKQESHVDSAEKTEKIDTISQNEKSLNDSSSYLFSYVILHDKQDKSRTLLKRNTELKQETETDLVLSTEGDNNTRNEDKIIVDKANRHLFTNVTKYTIEDKNKTLLENNDTLKKETPTEVPSQEHEYHIVDEGINIIDKNTSDIFSNVTGNKQDNKSVNISQEKDSLDTSKSLLNSVNIHQPHSLEITEGTARVRTNLNATHDQELSGRKLALEITEGTSQVSTNQEILHAVHRRADDHTQISNPNVPNPHLALNLHLSSNPYDDDKPHDVINVHKESRFSDNRQKDEGCNDESRYNVKRSDDESDNNRSSEEIDNNDFKTADSQSQVSPIPYISNLQDSPGITKAQHISSNLTLPLLHQTHVQIVKAEIKEDTGKTHQVDKRSRDSTSMDDIDKARKGDSNVQTDNDSFVENHRNEAAFAHVTPKSYEVFNSNETTTPRYIQDHLQNLSTVIFKSLKNELSLNGSFHSSVTKNSQPPQNEMSLQKNEQTGNHSNFADSEINSENQNETHVSFTKEEQDTHKSKDILHENTDGEKTLNTVESVSTEYNAESTETVTEKQEILSSTTVQQETSTAEKSEGVLDSFKSIVKFIGF